jgi:hypothetical protein
MMDLFTILLYVVFLRVGGIKLLAQKAMTQKYSSDVKTCRDNKYFSISTDRRLDRNSIHDKEINVYLLRRLCNISSFLSIDTVDSFQLGKSAGT